MVLSIRSAAQSATIGLCLLATACSYIPGSSKPASDSTKSAKATPEGKDFGAPLFTPADYPSMPAPTPQAEPIVINPGVVQYDMKVQIPAQVDGLIELIATPVTGDYDPSDPMIVFHPRDVEKKNPYRRLRENDTVVRGQTLVRLDEQLVTRQIEVTEKIIIDCARAIEAGQSALTSYEKTLEINIRLHERDKTVSLLEVENLRATVARLQEIVIQSEKEKTKAEGELIQAETQLARFWCRSPVNGRVVKLLKSPGEYAKAGEPILEIQSTDRIRVEGKLSSEYASQIRPGMSATVEPTVPLGPVPYANWHRQEVTDVAVTTHPDRPLVVSTGLDATALVWDITDTKRSHRLPHPGGVGVRAVASGKSGAEDSAKYWAATGADDGKVRLWDITNPDQLPREPANVFTKSHGSPVTALAASPDGRFLASAAGREVFIFDLQDNKQLYVLPAEHRDSVSSLHFTPQATLVTISRDRTIRVWKLGGTGAEMIEPLIDHRNGSVDILGISADGSRILFDKDGSRLDVLSLVDGQTVGTVQNSGGARFAGLALFSPNDQYILTSGGDADVRGELQLWDMPAVGSRATERRRLVTPGRAMVTCAAFSADPKHPFVVVGTQFGGVHYWTPPDESERLHQWVGQVESVLPADSRSVHVRVVMENTDETGADKLQDRSTATIIIQPEGQGKIVQKPAPANNPGLPAPMNVVPAGGVQPLPNPNLPKEIEPAAAVIPAGGAVAAPPLNPPERRATPKELSPTVQVPANDPPSRVTPPATPRKEANAPAPE